MTPQPGKQRIAIRILPNISKIKGNQTMKFAQLIEYIMRNIFPGKSYKKCGGETIPRLFSEKSKFTISLNQQNKILCNFFIVCQVEGYRNILKLGCRSLAFTSCKTYLKTKERSRTSFHALFSVWYMKENISLVIFY